MAEVQVVEKVETQPMLPGIAAPASSEPAPAAGEGEAVHPEGEGQEDKPKTEAEKLLSQDDVNRIVRKERRAAENRAYNRARLEMENERLARELAEARGGNAPKDAPAGKPRIEDYKDYDAYNEALVDWKVGERIKEARAAEREQAEKHVTSAKTMEYARTVQERMSAGNEKFDDFNEVISAPGVMFTEAMVDALLETDQPDVVAYTLASNPSESRRIAALSIAKQVLEVKAIAAKLSKAPEPTKAPEPIKPNPSNGSVKKSLDEITDVDEWIKERNRQLRKKS